MATQNEFSTLGKAALEKELKQLKGQERTAKFIMGFCVGIMIFGYATKGFGWVYTIIPVLIIGAMYKSTQPVQEKIREAKEALEQASE